MTVNGGLKHSFCSQAASRVPQCPALSRSQDTQKRSISARSLLKFTPKLQYLNSLCLDIFSCFSLGHRCTVFYPTCQKDKPFSVRGKSAEMKKEEKSNHKIRAFIFSQVARNKQHLSQQWLASTPKTPPNDHFFLIKKEERKSKGHLVVISNNQISLNIPVLLKILQWQMEVIIKKKKSALRVLKNVRLGRWTSPSAGVLGECVPSTKTEELVANCAGLEGTVVFFHPVPSKQQFLQGDRSQKGGQRWPWRCGWHHKAWKHDDKVIPP